MASYTDKMYTIYNNIIYYVFASTEASDPREGEAQNSKRNLIVNVSRNSARDAHPISITFDTSQHNLDLRRIVTVDVPIIGI